MRFISITAKAVLAKSFAQGKTNEQTFADMRAMNVAITYDQIVKYREYQQEQFNQSFDQIFKGAFA